MNLTDKQLMLLENLTYLDNNFRDKTNKDFDTTSNTVGELIKHIDTTALRDLGDETIDGGMIEADEWAAIIDEIRKDSQLMNLKINIKMKDETKGKIYAISAEDPDDSKNGYVLFRGTLDGYEWKDNFVGLTATDTEYQKEALQYVEGLSYDNITVVGHSKGGNKAQYVTVLSDKVNRCVSMDGQGFSKEFLDKYWVEVAKKGSCIKNYSLSNDFVHMLMYPVTGSKQIYVKGSGLKNGAENHSPSSFWNYYSSMVYDYRGTNYDSLPEQRGLHIAEGEDGTTALNIVDDEDEGITYLRGFVNYMMNVMPKDEKDEIAPFLGTLVGVSMSSDSLEYDGVTYNEDNIEDLIFKKKELTCKIMAYLLKYTEIYELDGDMVAELIREFNLDRWGVLDDAGGILYDDIVLKKDNNGHYYIYEKDEMKNFDDFIKALKISMVESAFNDPDSNLMIDYETELEVIDYFSNEDGVIFCRVDDYWSKAQQEAEKYGCTLDEMIDEMYAEYDKIPDVDKSAAIKIYTPRTGNKYIFTKDLYDALMDSADSMHTDLDVESLRAWSDMDWYEKLGVEDFIYAISTYYEKFNEFNSECKREIDDVFERELQCHNKYTEKMETSLENIRNLCRELEKLNDSLEA